MNRKVFRVVDRLDRPWAVHVDRDGMTTILVRRGEILSPALLLWLRNVATRVPAQRREALPATVARSAERPVYDVAGSAACATLPKISLAALSCRSLVVLTVYTDRGPLVIGDPATQATRPATADSPPVIGADELEPPAASPAGSSAAGRQVGRPAARRRMHRWVSVAVLAVGALWVTEAVDDAPADGRFGVATDGRMETLTVVTHAPPQTWPGITGY